MTPHVSILIPAYNQPYNLRYALESIARQTYKDYNVIITDDTREDRNFNVVKEFHNLPLTYHKNKVRFGSPANWNKALEYANGDYIKFLHHDDWFSSPDSLQLFVDALDNNPSADFAFSCSRACDTNHNSLWVHCATAKQLDCLKNHKVSLLQKNFIGAPSATIFRRSVNLDFDTRIKWVVDIDFYLRVLKQNPEFVFIPKDLVGITVGASDSVTAECQNSRRARIVEWGYLYSKVILGGF